MVLIREGYPVHDPWVMVADEDALPPKPVLLSLTRFLAERDALLERVSASFGEVPAPAIGVRLESSEAPDPLARDIKNLGLVAIDFPTFRDGRGYSYARLLRERYGFQGELRATGNVLRDQLFFMVRCGFNTFEVEPEITREIWEDATGTFTAVYQPASDSRQTVNQLRHKNET